MTTDDKIKQYFDIKLDTLDFIIKNHDDFASTSRPAGYFADLVFFAEYFGLDHDERFIKSAKAFGKAYNIDIENYDIDTSSDEE